MREVRFVLRDLTSRGYDWSSFVWSDFRPGVEISRLYQDGEGASAALLRYAPGARVPLHEHNGYEHILVLEGEQRDERGTYETGTLLVHGPRTRHSVASDRGCVVLAIWERTVAIVGEVSA